MPIRNALMFVALAAVLVISSPALAHDEGWDKVVAAAKSEGKVTFYSGLVGSPSTAAVARAFGFGAALGAGFGTGLGAAFFAFGAGASFFFRGSGFRAAIS